MALTGLGLALFLLAHVAGNLVILVSTTAFNQYAHALTSNLALLYTAEAGLIALFVVHIVLAIQLTRRNRAARPVAYYRVSNTGRSRRFWGSSNMAISGLVILIFIVYHILHFKFGPSYSTIEGETPMRDLARLVFEEFAKPSQVAIYEIALLMLGMHLWHGFRSLWDTLGVGTSRCDKLIKRITHAYVIVVIGGFMMIPLWIFLTGGAA
jgi:succinate dehydrogenase / fumarate reductase cytochrome b subunit